MQENNIKFSPDNTKIQENKKEEIHFEKLSQFLFESASLSFLRGN
jgi:hypothetical protein